MKTADVKVGGVYVLRSSGGRTWFDVVQVVEVDARNEQAHRTVWVENPEYLEPAFDPKTGKDVRSGLQRRERVAERRGVHAEGETIRVRHLGYVKQVREGVVSAIAAGEPFDWDGWVLDRQDRYTSWVRPQQVAHPYDVDDEVASVERALREEEHRRDTASQAIRDAADLQVRLVAAGLPRDVVKFSYAERYPTSSSKPTGFYLRFDEEQAAALADLLERSI